MFLKISDVKDFTCGFLKSLWKFVLAIFQTRNEQNNMGNMSGIVVKKLQMMYCLFWPVIKMLL